ncbi:MAG: hypothetical protein KGJ53_01145 [Alphaproteobacteria bacterium]|nr:hypothetical protein [Alphaproteobacteria bacterium]
MKAQQSRSRMLQRAKTKESQTHIGPRVFVFFVVVALVTGIIGISVNANFEKWKNAHDVYLDNR